MRAAPASWPDDGANPKPTTLDGAYKLACEGVGRSYAADYGLASVGFRPLIIYGPGREVGSTAGVTLACRAAAVGDFYAIPFTGESDLIFVDDVAAAFEAALTRPIAGAHALTLVGEVVSVDALIGEIGAFAPAPVRPRVSRFPSVHGWQRWMFNPCSVR